MKATGVVRRIDDLGRVVIPKEIRRTLRIKEGDPLEIFTDREGQVILKKYSPIGELSEFASEYAETLNKTTGHIACITDKDTIIAVSGTSKKDWLEKGISTELERILEYKEKYISKDNNDVAVPITANETNDKLKNAQIRIPSPIESLDYIDLYIMHAWDESIAPLELMTILDGLVKSGKVRHIGVSNALSWQVAQANEIAKAHGLTRFASMQGHYNLIFREEEREMAKLCNEDNIAMTPYSALASGRLAKHPGEQSKRMQEDSYAKGKYDATEKQDRIIIDRVDELAKKRGVTMTEISLAWLMSKVAAPVVGATKVHHIDGAVKATELELTDEEKAYLEEPYQPHALVGMMAQK